MNIQMKFYVEKAIVEYIDYYNHHKIKLKLNGKLEGLNPVQYRTQSVRNA